MEHLQLALEKARRLRGTAMPAGTTTGAATGAATGATTGAGAARLHLVTPLPAARRPDPAAAWRALPEFELDRAVLARGRIVSRDGGAAAAPWDLLRGRLLDEARRNGWRRIALSSPTPGAGRTTALANLALSCARAPGLRLIALDLDLRRPTLGRLLGQHPLTDLTGSLVDVLAGRSPFAAAARRLGEATALGIAHDPVANPADLLCAKTAHDAINAIEDAYAPDLILIDTPPLTAAAEAHAALNLADAAILVAEAGKTTTKQIDNAEHAIANLTNTIGTIINKAKG